MRKKREKNEDMSYLKLFTKNTTVYKYSSVFEVHP
ncbi:Uncharacterised protein [Enterobacter roggenkampii]|nr:Uncharacterised protein [Enterobacter hormaechei]SAE46209.1 Uncharacterised protein [Enterobacter roggenkampii]SAI56972.1 Uncharacterised protein [Enterobacter hormaechei]